MVSPPKAHQGILSIDRYASPCGQLSVGGIDGQICLCEWDEPLRMKRSLNRLYRFLGITVEEAASPVTDRAFRQLDEYFAGQRKAFSLPLRMVGTPFQMEVWNLLTAIDYGNTTNYKWLSEQMKSPQAVRAVAAAIGANPMSILIPCHRVVGSDGSLTGYAGGLSAKHYLLALEKRHSDSPR
ncbi:MAG: methylated-DNA--[Bacteroidales bacterium]|nr:methylated-DNA--[protein]-cysteine S-methyltransferase [Bacteroidales bacterium]